MLFCFIIDEIEMKKEKAGGPWAVSASSQPSGSFLSSSFIFSSEPKTEK